MSLELIVIYYAAISIAVVTININYKHPQEACITAICLDREAIVLFN